MGESPHPLKHEWSPLERTTAGLLDIGKTLANIERLDAAHEIWGWKSPQDLFVLDEVLPMLREPGFIIPTRDVSEVGLSARGYESIPIEIALRESALVYETLCNKSRLWPWPILFIPFRAALENQSDFVDLLCSFLNIERSAEAKAHAVGFVRPQPNAYRHVDLSIPDAACVISPRDLKADAETSAARITRSYSVEYLKLFEANLAATKKLLAGTRSDCLYRDRFGAPTKFAIRVRNLLSRLPDRQCRSKIVRAFDDISHEFEFEQGLEELAAAARALASKGNNWAAPDGYEDVISLFRVLQILIRIRTELQRIEQHLPASS